MASSLFQRTAAPVRSMIPSGASVDTPPNPLEGVQIQGVDTQTYPAGGASTQRRLFSTAPSADSPAPNPTSATGAGSTSIFKPTQPTQMADLKMIPPDHITNQDRADLLYSIIPEKIAAGGSKDEVIDALLVEADRLSSQAGSHAVQTGPGKTPELFKRGPVTQTIRNAVADIATGPVTAILKPFGRKGAVNTLDFPEVKLQRIEQFLTKYDPEALDGFQQRQKVQGVSSGAKMAGGLVEFGLEAGVTSANIRPLISGLPIIQKLANSGTKGWYAAKVIENSIANAATFVDLGITKEQDKGTVMRNILSDPAAFFPYARKWEMVAAPFANYLASRAIGMSKENALYSAMAGGVGGVMSYRGNQADLSIFKQKQGIEHLSEMASMKAEQIHIYQQSHPDDFQGLQKMQDEAIADLTKEHRLIFKSGGKQGTAGIDYGAEPPKPEPSLADLSPNAKAENDAMDAVYARGGTEEEAIAARNAAAKSTVDMESSSTDSLSPSSSEYLSSVKKAQTEARIGAKGTVMDRVKGFFGKVKADLIDSNAPIEDALAAAEKKYGFQVLQENSINDRIAKALRFQPRASQFIEDHGLFDVIKNTDNIDDLDQLLIAKQGLAVWDNKMSAAAKKAFLSGETPEGGITYSGLTGRARTMEGDQALVAELGPKFAKEVAMVRAYSDKVLEMMSTPINEGGYGLIAPELAASLKEQYPDYVPLNRIFSDTEEVSIFNTKQSTAHLSQQTVVQKIKGSGREVESPTFNLMSKTYSMFAQGERNRAAAAIASYEKLPGMEGLIREIAEGEKVPFKISFLDNGVKREFETTKDIAEAAKNLNVQQVSLLGKIFAQMPVRVFKAGTTGLSLPFVGANIAKDNVSAFVNSEQSLAESIANPKVFFNSLWKAGKEAVNHGELTDEMVRAGASGTSFDAFRNQQEDSFAYIRSFRNAQSRAKYVATSPSEMLRSVENILSRGEEVTRTRQFLAAKQSLMKEGMREDRAVIEAARAYRENTADFLRKGNFGSVLNSTIPYFNAGIQGSRSLIRAFMRDPAATSGKAAIAVFFPMAVTTAWNLMDPERKAAYDDIQDWEKKGNLIIVPPHPTKDDQGRWNVIKIPMPPGLGDFASLVRKPIEAMHGGDPVGFGDVAQALVGGVSPFNVESPSKFMSGVTPQVLRPALQQVTNKNLFTGAPIVSDKLSRLPPEMQVKPGTSGTVRALAKPFGLSPIKTQTFLKDTFGGLSENILNVSDNVLSQFGYIKPEDVGGQNVVKAMAARFSKAAGQEDRNQLYEEFNKILGAQDVHRLEVSEKAEMWATEHAGDGKFTQKSALQRLKKTDAELADRISDVIVNKKKGLGEEERLIMQLGVTDGYRAKYIQSKIDALPESEKAAYIKDLKKKGVISKEVQKQLGLRGGLFSGASTATSPSPTPSSPPRTSGSLFR